MLPSQLLSNQNMVRINTDPHLEHGWQRPSAGIFKINRDASFDCTIQKIGIGVVVRSHENKVVGTLRAAKPLTCRPFEVESVTLFMAVKFCKDVRIDSCLLEGDSL